MHSPFALGDNAVLLAASGTHIVVDVSAHPDPTAIVKNAAMNATPVASPY